MSSAAPDPSPRQAPLPTPADADAWAPTQILPRAAPQRPAGVGNALPVGTRMAEFEVLRVIGEGGFGIVYLVQDHMLQRRVAIKEYMPASLAMRGEGLSVQVKAPRDQSLYDAGLDGFLQEARMLAQFDHPALLKVYRFWQANGTAYMVMPFYEGTTLKAALKSMGAAPDERWLMALLAPLTEALSVLHAERCYHRDIAPDNILLLSGSGKPLLLDFGAARMVISDATQALTAILKPGYAPVEQYAEVPGMKQGPWTDVYALCAVVYAAITGGKPPAAVGRTVQDNYVPLVKAAAGRYAAGFLQAIDHGLRVRPEDRTQSIQELRQALAIDGGGAGGVTVIVPTSARPSVQAPISPPPVTVMPTPAQRPMPQVAGATAAASASPASNKLWLGLGAGGVALAVAAGVLWMRQGASAPTATTPPAATTPAAPVAAQAAWAPAAELDRIARGAAPGFDVQAGTTRPSLRIGQDSLTISVRSSRDGYLYVMSATSDGSWWLLYPASASAPIRVRAGQAITLPPSSWPGDAAAGGTELPFIALVSESPRDFSALGLAPLAGHQKLAPAASAAASTRTAPGTTPILAGKAQCDGAGCDLYGAARFSVSLTR